MTSSTSTQNKFIEHFLNVKNSKTIQTINNILSSPWGLAILGVLTIFSYIFSLEIVLYSFVAFFVLYVCFFCDDFLPLISLFVFCYVSPSRNNNPGQTSESVFTSSGVGIIIIVSICLLAILLRIGLDKNMGYKKMFTQKRSLLWGMLALGLAYFLSGIGSVNYSELVWKNLFFAFLQFISIFLLYFIFTTTINWEKVRKDYFAWLGVIMGIVVAFELMHIYLSVNLIEEGVILRKYIYTGWGMRNNIGEMLALSIPFAFYLACKKKHTYIYLILATLLFCSTVLSCSRSSMLFGGIVYLISFIITFIKAENKKWFRISCGILIGVVAIFVAIFFNKLIKIFEDIPAIITSNNNQISFIDNSRLEIYENGFKAFLKYPIFGQTFYPTDYIPYDFSTIDSFSSFFPPRWHNTYIQLLSSCGIVGMLAYIFHRYQTIKLFVKKPTLEKTFIALSLVIFLSTSLLDCHFFNIGPTMFYSLALLFAENSPQTNADQNIKIENENQTKAIEEKTETN